MIQIKLKGSKDMVELSRNNISNIDLNNVLKKDLINICDEFKIKNINKSWNKVKIINVIHKHFKPFKFIDLFCGIGSFHYSFSKLGLKCVMACDINQHAREIYEKNYNIKPQGDIVDIDPKDISRYDIICAGFSCQPFSNIGKHKGFDDERGNMFFQVMKFVSYHKPKIIVLENVMGLLSHDSGKTFNKIINILNEHEYNVEHVVLKCSDYGIPQMRKRLFFICIKNKRFPSDFDNWNDIKIKSPTLSTFFNKKFEKTTAYTIRCGGRSSPINDKHNWDGYIVDGKEYRLTPEDCLKLQGFPNSFILNGSKSQKYKRLGNTIPTNLTSIVGKKCLKLLDNWNDLEDEKKYHDNVYKLKESFGNISLDLLDEIYNKSISLFQTCKNKSGKGFEKRIENLLTKNNICYSRQVSIDDDGIIKKRCEKTKNIPDIVVGKVSLNTSIL